MIASLLLPSFSASAESFEKSLQSFPKSYQDSIRKLHNEYPNWSFSPVYTGLSWNEAVQKEGGFEGIVPSSSEYSDMFKSRSSQYYNYSSGTYISQSYSSVVGSDFAVSFFLDPRNFLTVQGIFQFEKLSFDSSVTQNDVENSLRGTFMYKAKASYYNRSGSYVTNAPLYSKIIYMAGKKYNINPLYLSAKIIGEIGAHGSVSTYGTNPSYPGIYNFYNIGAYDGSNAAVKGLAWAASGSTYNRPWTSPKKSIFGGAEFLASSYIGVGQDTNYFQKFNVKPGAYNPPYSHQYMTNVWGAAEISYSTYRSCKTNGTLGSKRSFLIPVFKDMPEINDCTGSLSLLDAQGQHGVTKQSCNLRSGPDEYMSIVAKVPSGKLVKILGAYKTSTLYPESILKYPVWAKISYSSNGKTYTGYVYYNLLRLKTTKIVKVGTYTPVQIKSNSELSFRFLSRDETIAKGNGKKITFLKAGTVDVYAYDSLGRFSCVRYSVRNDISKKKIEAVQAAATSATSANVSWKKNSTFKSYKVTLLDSANKLVATKTTSGTSVSFGKLSENTKHKVFVTGISGYTVSATGSAVTFSTAFVPPKRVTGLKAKQSKDLLSVELSWNKASGSDGYTIYKYNFSKKKYVAIGSTTLTKFSFEDPTAVKGGSFRVRAYKFAGNKKVFADYSNAVKYTPGNCKPKSVSSFSAKGVSGKTIKLKWSSVKNATGYRIFVFNEKTKKYKQIKYTTVTNCTVSDLQSLKKYKFKIRPVTVLYGKKFVGKVSSAEAYTLPLIPKNVKSKSLSNGEKMVSWSKVEGADGYFVYSVDLKSGKATRIKRTSLNSFSFSFAAGQTKMKLKIKSYAVIGNKTYASKATSPILIKK